MPSERETFVERSCPYCHANIAEELFVFKSIDFCPLNWTYSKEYKSILKLGPDSVFPVVRCLSCGFMYASLLPSEAFLNKLYNEVIDVALAEKGSTARRDYARRLRYCAQLLQFCPQDGRIKVLDFGAGYGLSSAVLGEIGLDILAYDPSLPRIERIASHGIHVTSSLSELQHAEPFDVIICDNVLEHVPDIHTTARLFADCIAEEGFLYVSVPSYEKKVIRKLQEEVAAGHLSDMTLNPWEHLNYFDLAHLDALFVDYGFQPLRRCDLSSPVDVGLRAEQSVFPRLKNGLASILRLLRYLVMGTANESVNDRFYRFGGRA